MPTEIKILTNEHIQEWIDDNLFFEHPTKFVPVIVQAVLNSPEVVALRADEETFRRGAVVLASVLETVAEQVGIDLSETRISARATGGDELASVSISEVIDKVRAAMEKKA